MNSESITPLADADFTRVLSATSAVLDAQLATAKARRALDEIIGQIIAARAEHRGDDTALAELQQRWPVLSAAYNSHLLDCCEADTEPVPFAEWVRDQGKQKPVRLAPMRPIPHAAHTATLTGRALHAGAPAIADADFQATGK